MSIFIALYSYIPHKELRFIFPALPIFTACASISLVKVWNGASKDRFSVLLAALGVAVCAIASVFFLYVSSLNYPGGYAFDALHKIDMSSHGLGAPPLKVHIDNPAAISGVSRFGEDQSRFT